MSAESDEEFTKAGGGVCVFAHGDGGFLVRWSASPIGFAQVFTGGKLVARAACSRVPAQSFEGWHHTSLATLLGELAEAGLTFDALDAG